MLYIEFLWETGEAILGRCHIHVFEYLGGVPQRFPLRRHEDRGHWLLVEWSGSVEYPVS